VYARVESPRGEYGWYLVSKGGNRPWRMKLRSPCFCNLSALREMTVGEYVSDAVAIIGYLNGYGSTPVPKVGATVNVGGSQTPVDYGKPFGFVDATGDGVVAPEDAVAVINFLNAFGAAPTEDAVGKALATYLRTLLAADLRQQQLTDQQIVGDALKGLQPLYKPPPRPDHSDM